MVDAADITFAILVGGRGERLGGVTKASLRLGGRTFLERQRELGRPFARTLLVGATQLPVPPGVARIDDLVPGRGAPGGVHAALAAASTTWLLVVACDMPFISHGAIDLLRAAARPDTEWACFEREGRLEPLLGLYKTSLEPRFRAVLETRGASFLELLAPHLGVRITGPRASAIDPSLHFLDSVNHPEDLERWGIERPS